MTASIHAAFDFATVGAFSVSFTDSGGTKAVSLTTGKNTHVNVSSVVSTLNYFATRLQTAINGAPLAGTYTVTFNASTLKYTISSTVTFSMTFTLPSVGSRVLGFTANKSGANTYTSDVAVYYSIALRRGGISNPTDDYEPAGYAEDAFVEGGDHYGVRAGVSPTFFDFTAPSEKRAATFKRAALAAVPWTYQHFFEHVRNVESFALVTDTETSVLRLRADGARWAPQRLVQNYDDLWSIPFATALRGRV